MIADSYAAAPTDAPPLRESAFDVLERAHLQRVRSKWLVLLGLPPLFSLMTTVVLSLLPPTYEAEGTVMMHRGVGGINGNGSFRKRDFGDEIALLSTREFKQRVVAELPPEDRSRLTRQQFPRASGKRQKSSRSDPTAVLRTGVRVSGDLETTMLHVTDDNEDAHLAAALVNATIRAAFRSGTEIASARSRTMQLFFAPRVAALEDLVRSEEREQDRVVGEAAGQAMVQSQQRSSSSFATRQDLKLARRQGGSLEHTDQREAITFSRPLSEITLDTVRSASTKASLNARQMTARLRVLTLLQSADPGSIDRTNDPILQKLQDSLAEAQATYEAMATDLGSNNPEMVERATQLKTLEAQIAAIRASHLREAHTAVVIAERQASVLEAQVQAEQQRVGRVLAAQQLSAMHELDLAVNLTLLADLREKLRGYELSAGLNAPLIEAVDLAEVPTHPIGFSRVQSVVYGGAAGLLLALIAIAWMQVRTRRQWSLFSLENAAGRPALALLKQVSTAGGSLISAPESADSLREIQSALGLMRGGQASMTLVFTCSRGGEGTTTIVTALALLLAQSGERVLLIDANLYRPALHRRLALTGKLGLSQVLSGGETLEDAAQHLDRGQGASLDVLTSGPMPPIPSQLLQSAAFDGLLQQARRRYSYVLLDSAPAGAPIGLLSMREVDAVLLIARFNKVELRQVRYTEEHLRKAPFRAVLVNGVPKGRLRPEVTPAI